MKNNKDKKERIKSLIKDLKSEIGTEEPLLVIGHIKDINEVLCAKSDDPEKIATLLAALSFTYDDKNKEDVKMSRLMFKVLLSAVLVSATESPLNGNAFRRAYAEWEQNNPRIIEDFRIEIPESDEDELLN